LTIEEIYPVTLFESLAVDGIGIMVRAAPPDIHKRFYSSRFSKTGREVNERIVFPIRGLLCEGR